MFKRWKVKQHDDYDATYRVIPLERKFHALDDMPLETEADEDALAEQEAALRIEEEKIRRMFEQLPAMWALVESVLGDTEKFTLRAAARKIAAAVEDPK